MTHEQLWDRVSASQVKDFAQVCQRYWHFKSILKIREPATEAMQRGTDVHKYTERILQGQRLPDPTPFQEEALSIARAAEEALIPYSIPGTLIEHKFTLPTYEGGPTWIGYIDFLATRPKPKMIGDHKTTSDFRYRKTPEELLKDPQLMSYSRWAAEEWPHDDGFQIAHFYVRTRKPYKTMSVEAFALRDRIIEFWEGPLLDTVKSMQEASVIKNTLDLPATRESCRRYGKPCYFVKQCAIGAFSGVSLVQIRDPRKVDETPTPEELNMADLNATPNGTTPTTPAPKKLSLSEKLAQTKAAQAAPAPAAPDPAPAPAPVPAAQTAPVAARNSDILPSDAPPRDAGKSAGAPAPAPPAETKPEEEQKKAGRSKKAKTTEEKPSESGHDTTGTLFPAMKDGFTLYVDCMPVRGLHHGKGVLLETWLAPIMRQLAESFGLEDVRLAEDNSPAAYGKWKAHLTQLVSAKASREEVPSVLLISSFALGAHECLDALIPMATSVIRGLR